MEIGTSLVVEADYKPQRIARFRGKRLIEALPLPLSEAELADALTILPSLDPEEREWETHERMQQTMQLSHFLIPFERNLRLARAIDALMREGLVGREPRSAEFVERLQAIYRNEQQGTFFAGRDDNPQLSAALLGLPGVGKSRTVSAVLQRYPTAIYHPMLDIWQIPAIMVETPSNGASPKDLVYAIFRQVDRIVPGADYSVQYGETKRLSENALKNCLARVLHIHCVGLLILDEIQNLANAPRNKQSLMSTLVSMSNELGVPILFVGTGGARKILGLAPRQARRSAGFGIEPWDRLVAKDPQDPNTDWSGFLECLWPYQWVRNPVPLSPSLRHCMYDLSQGIPDLAIKLFVCAQWVAMYDGSETITDASLERISRDFFSVVEPAIAALRHNNLSAMHEMPDIQAPEFDSLWAQVEAQPRSEAIRKAIASVKAAQESLLPTAPRQPEALIQPETATAKSQRSRPSESNAQRSRLPGRKPAAPMEYPPGDLRGAFVLAEAEQVPVATILARMGHSPALASLVRI
ncbi:ATP-binding protein [Cupriavidus necator]|uniref:Transposase n=1 Tax=Cupriavidus necator TaxID=106590 RepID=A0A367PQY3_CUPNE|nr:ATP-binding protein [Cupriavidus necator]QQX86585.1 ATP-binding protein [Cupriavidus necator]RCJ10003.1 transposase [Cupriavidus necator]